MLTIIRSLTQEQQLECRDFLNKMFEGSLDQKLHDSVNSCPNCGSASFKKFGRVRGKQRYMCKECSKTFGANNKTAFYCSKRPLEQWNHYIELMFSGHFSLRRMAENVGIHYTTAFYWRQKILHALEQVPGATLDGIVEADETYFNLSFKGQRKLPTGWKERKIKRGISKQKVCVLTAMDRTKNMLLRSTCLARPTGKQVTNVLDGHVAAGALLVTDRHNAYPICARNLGLAHEALNCATSLGENGIHVQNVNNLHSQLKGFMRPFKGVATKYLDHYLAFYKFTKMNPLPAVAQPTASITRVQLRAMRMNLK